MNSQEYLTAVKFKTSTFSDNGIAKRLGITRAFITQVRNGESGFGHESAMKIAAILELHPAKVMADCSIDRAKTPEERLVWREISERFSPFTSCVLLQGEAA